MAILRIRDENGVWIDIPALKGDPGKDGSPGAPGKDYVLTDEDKQEIAELINIPTKVSQLENDSKFVNEDKLNEIVGDIERLLGGI